MHQHNRRTQNNSGQASGAPHHPFAHQMAVVNATPPPSMQHLVNTNPYPTYAQPGIANAPTTFMPVLEGQPVFVMPTHPLGPSTAPPHPSQFDQHQPFMPNRQFTLPPPQATPLMNQQILPPQSLQPPHTIPVTTAVMDVQPVYLQYGIPTSHHGQYDQQQMIQPDRPPFNMPPPQITTQHGHGPSLIPQQMWQQQSIHHSMPMATTMVDPQVFQMVQSHQFDAQIMQGERSYAVPPPPISTHPQILSQQSVPPPSHSLPPYQNSQPPLTQSAPPQHNPDPTPQFCKQPLLFSIPGSKDKLNQNGGTSRPDSVEQHFAQLSLKAATNVSDVQKRRNSGSPPNNEIEKSQRQHQQKDVYQNNHSDSQVTLPKQPTLYQISGSKDKPNQNGGGTSRPGSVEQQNAQIPLKNTANNRVDERKRQSNDPSPNSETEKFQHPHQKNVFQNSQYQHGGNGGGFADQTRRFQQQQQRSVINSRGAAQGQQQPTQYGRPPSNPSVQTHSRELHESQDVRMQIGGAPIPMGGPSPPVHCQFCRKIGHYWYQCYSVRKERDECTAFAKYFAEHSLHPAFLSNHSNDMVDGGPNGAHQPQSYRSSHYSRHSYQGTGGGGGDRDRDRPQHHYYNQRSSYNRNYGNGNQRGGGGRMLQRTGGGGGSGAGGRNNP